MRLMSRSGLSISMSYVVIGLIMLVTATSVILYFTGNMDLLRQITGNEFDKNKKSLARSHCLTEKQRLCNSAEYSSGSQKWAQDVSYDGMTCREWATAENIFGSGGADDIPKCK